MSAVLELATVLFLLPCYSQSVPFEKVVSLQYAELGQPYQNQTSHLLEIQYLFTIGSRVDFFPSKTLTLRTELISTCPEEDSHGLNIIVRNPHGTTTSWDMDSIQRSSVRSLCLGSPTSGTTITEEINVLVSTFCKSGLDFELQLYEEESFQALIRQVQKVRGVGVGRPAVRYLDLRDVDMERHLQVNPHGKYM